MNPKHKEAFTKAAISATQKSGRVFNPEEIMASIRNLAVLNIDSLRQANAAILPDFEIYLDSRLNLALKSRIFYRNAYLASDSPSFTLAVFPSKGLASLWRPLASRALLAAIGRDAFIERQWGRLARELAQFDARERVSLFREALWTRDGSAATPDAQAVAESIESQETPICLANFKAFAMAAAKSFRAEDQRYDRPSLVERLSRLASQNVQALSDDGLLSYASLRVGRERHRIQFKSSQALVFNGTSSSTVIVNPLECLNLSFDPLPDSFFKLPILLFRRAQIFIFGRDAFIEAQWRQMAKSLAGADAILRAKRGLPLPATLLSEVESVALAKAAPPPPTSSTPAPPARARSL